MRKSDFYVPTDVATEFVEALTEHHDLENTITGVTEEGELIIEVSYEKEEVETIDELEALLESLIENLEQEEEEEEEEDDE